jgi:PAS domain S-box-containing protein
MFSTRNTVMLGFGASVLALVVIGWLAYHTTTHLVAALDSVAHTHEVIAKLESGLASLTDAESAQRVFLLTGDDRSAQDSQLAQRRVQEWIEELRPLTADNPAQQRRLDELEQLIAQRLASMNERMAQRRSEGIEAVANALVLRSGQNLMDRIRETIAEMHTAENLLLEQRSQAARAGTRSSLAIIIGGSSLAVVIGLLAVQFIRRDLRLREKAEHDSWQTRALLASILDNTPAIAFLKDLQGRYLFVNRRMAEVNGRPREELIGKTVWEVTPKELAAAAEEHQRTVLAKQGPVEFEETVMHPDGPHTHLAVKFPVRDAAGNIYALAGVSTDITARKRAEEERDRFFNLSRDLMCIANFDGYFTAVNPAWESTLGHSREELLAQPFVEFVHPDDRAATLAEAEKLSRGEVTVNFQNRYRTRDGGYRWLAWSAQALPAQHRIYATGRDITEQKHDAESIARLNEDLQRRAAQLEAANKELEAFSYSVSHDLRAPLRHIDGFVGLLTKSQGDRLDERGQRQLKVIADAARQMGALSDDLLVFSRMGRAELRHVEVDLVALANEVVTGLESELSGRSVAWKIGRLPAVHADRALLRQVLANLFGNAVKYTRPRAAAEIEMGHTNGSPENEIIFFVRDNGVGFDMQYVDKLFGVFQRLHRSDEFEGTGIGLANVRRIINRHGGRTWAESEPGRGATFYFTLPQTQTIHHATH